MDNIASLLDFISTVNKRINKDNAKNILILYDEKVLFIGDTCIKFGMLGLFKSFFPEAAIDINWQDTKFTGTYNALLLNNPYLRSKTNQEWEQLDIPDYDIVICIMHEEALFLEFLFNKYDLLADGAAWNTAVFSMSQIGLNLTTRTVSPVFPFYDQLAGYALQYKHEPQLFISEEEREWADRWLEEHGLEAGKQLFIILDAASSNKKLLAPDTFGEILRYLLKREHARVLIFDEKNIGKEHRYRSLLGEDNISGVIFAKSLGLRNDLCLLSSKYTRLILGPCTGLLHCASGIYNQFAEDGMSPSEIPLMVTYTGKYEGGADNNAQLWWGSSPLVNCLILKGRADCEKELVLLHELDDSAKTDASNILPCQEYTAALITAFLEERLS